MDERLQKATKELAEAAADKSKEAFGKAKNIAENIDTEEINKQVKKIGKETKKELEKHSKNAKNASLGIAAFWKKLSKRNQMIVAVIGIIIVCGLVSGGRNAILNGEDIFTGLFFISVAILIYDIVKKKRKKKAIIAVVIFLILAQLSSSLRISNMGYAQVLGMTKNEVEKKYGVPIENNDPSYCYSEGFHVFYVGNKAALVEIATELIYPGYPASEGKIMGLSLKEDVDSIEGRLKRYGFDVNTGTKAEYELLTEYIYKNSKYTLTIDCFGSKINYIGLQLNQAG